LGLVTFIFLLQGSGGSGEVSTADFLFVNGGFVFFLDNGPDFLQGGSLVVGGDDGGLNEELVSAFGGGGRFFFHGLEENLDFNFLAGFNATRVGTNAVLFGSGSLDFESDGLVVWVRDC